MQPLAASNGAQGFNIISAISGSDAVALLVDIRHEGFTRYSSRTPIGPSVYLQAKLAALQTQTVTPAAAVSISGASTNGFTLQTTDGNEGGAAMSISIPASSLPAGTTSLSAAIKTYDPNDPADAQYFPGSYADSTGNGLVSVAFNYAEVKTDNGQTLQAVAQNSRVLRQARGTVAFADPPEPVIINRTIPASSCATLEKLGDANAELAGFQIPVYTYNPNSGLWDLLGYGSVFTDAGVAVGGQTSNLDCANAVYILEIKVSNEIFLSEWWNLDYPLQFAEPLKRCANLRILNEENQPLAGVYGLISGDGDFSSQYFVADDNGNVNVSLDVFSDTVNSAEFIIWGSTGALGSFNLSPNCPAVEPQTIVVKRPQLCKIRGQVSYGSGRNLANFMVFAQSEKGILSEYYFAFGTTNNEGIYSLDVACDTPYTVNFVTSSQAEFTGVNVDAAVGARELSDDGKQVYLADTVFTAPPYPSSVAFGYDRNNQEAVVFFIGMFDAFPITYDLQLKNIATGQVLVEQKGSLNFDSSLFEDELSQWFLRIGQVKVPLVLPLDLSNFRVQGSFTDNFGIKSTVDSPVVIYLDEGLSEE